MRRVHPARARRGRASIFLATLGVVVATVLAACGGAASAPDSGGGGAPAGPGATAAPIGGGNSSGGSGSDGSSSGGSGSGGNGENGGSAGSGASAPPAGPVFDAVRPDLLVIKTGTLVLEVEDVDGAVTAAANAVGGLGGYISGSSQAGAGDDVTATITFRIPADQWDAALVALRGLATTVASEQTQTDDVTGEVVDLAARVRNLEATERAVQAVMDRATTIDEILTVQEELTKIRGEIEQAASARGHLEEQATYSTLTVRFQAPPVPVASPTPAPTPVAAVFDPGEEAGRATETLVGILERLAKIGIWFGIVWLPILLGLTLIGLVVWLVVRNRLPARSTDGWAGRDGPPEAKAEA